MKKSIILFYLFSFCYSVFAIPDFDNISWGFNKGAIALHYPNLKNEFTTNSKVSKYNFYPKNSNFNKITFFLYEDSLYKVVKEFSTSKINPGDVKELFNEFSSKWGTPTHSIISESFSNFSIEGNKQTWQIGNSYISLVGKDRFDKEKRLIESKLILEYGLIDPINSEEGTNLKSLILTD